MSYNDTELLKTADATAKAHYRDFQIARDLRKSNKNNRALISAAGKSYVAFQLAARGVEPTILGKPANGANIIIKGTRTHDVKLRVKASPANNNPRQWDAGPYCYDAIDYYIFVNLWDDYPARDIECFVIPSKIVEEQLALSKSKRPQFILSKKDKAKEENFLNNWNSIKELSSPNNAFKQTRNSHGAFSISSFVTALLKALVIHEGE